MWAAVAEEDIKCSECSHTIPAGTKCLSQMPVPMPDGFRRRKYDNFCVECAECNAKRRQPPCYVRHLSHWYTRKEKTTESVSCVYCGEAILQGAATVAQKLYAWPESDDDSQRNNGASDGSGVGTGFRAAGTSLAGAAKRADAGAWQNLSPQTQSMFRTRGLGRGLGSRSPVMARRFYETSVPEAIRNQGESAVLRFLKGKHASHLKSVSNRLGWAKRPSNAVWEGAKRNLKRGSWNMTATELNAVKSANRVSAFRATARGAARGGLVAAAIEAAVSIPENILHYRRGRKSRKQAAQDIAKDTSIAAGVGVATWGVAQGTAMAGVGLTLGPFGTPLMIAGGGLMAGTAAYRLYKAAKRDLPLGEYRVYLCRKSNCRKKYARQVNRAAMGRSEHNNVWGIRLALAGLAASAIAVVVWLM